MTSENSAASRHPAVSFGDPEPPFFRAWALRSSEHDLSDPSSTSSTPISPKTVPKTVLARAKKASYQAQCSEAVNSTAAPPKPKDGYKWKREISRHWFQLRIGRKGQSEARLIKKSEETTPAVPDATTTANTPLQGNSSTRTYNDPALPTPGQKEGFYGRVKRKIGFRQEPAKSVHDELGVKTLTGEMLNRASRILRPLAERNGTPPSISPSDSMNGLGSNPSIASSHHNRIVPLFPFYYKPGNSSSSSSRDMKMVYTPQGTPESHALYTGSDNQQYFRVELTDPDAPSFLPSEARRIGTPPPRGSTLRGFFFDYNTPEGYLPSPEALEGSPTRSRRPRQKRNHGAYWYKVKMEALEASDARPQDFILDVPEHLLNSPLCPRHPKHPSGGKGVCVYHGRNKSIDEK